MDKKRYTVAEGVTWVNGSPVPKDRIVELTAAEAAFDLSYARIELAKDAQAVPAEKPASEKAAGDGKARL